MDIEKTDMIRPEAAQDLEDYLFKMISLMGSRGIPKETVHAYNRVVSFIYTGVDLIDQGKIERSLAFFYEAGKRMVNIAEDESTPAFVINNVLIHHTEYFRRMRIYFMKKTGETPDGRKVSDITKDVLDKLYKG